eukprot:366196-Chlamydomonas_euryale.AAC.2
MPRLKGRKGSGANSAQELDPKCVHPGMHASGDAKKLQVSDAISGQTLVATSDHIRNPVALRHHGPADVRAAFWAEPAGCGMHASSHGPGVPRP